VGRGHWAQGRRQGSLTDEPGQGSSAGMNDMPDNDKDAARRKLVGRAMVIGLLVLVAVYAVFTYMGRR
jgi:hypothetical protein